MNIKKIQQHFMLLFILFTVFSANTYAVKYTEGKQYTQVSEIASSKAEVREYFSFYCPHCFRFEPFMEEIKNKLPEGVSFERNHVDFLRAASPKIQAMLTKSVVVAEQLGMDKKLISAVFSYIHVQHAVITSEKDVKNIFVLNGADGEKFDKLMRSFSVNSKAKSMKNHQKTMSQKRAITGVPAVIINGKYRINPQALDKNNFEQDYQSLVTYLLTLK